MNTLCFRQDSISFHSHFNLIPREILVLALVLEAPVTIYIVISWKTITGEQVGIIQGIN